MYCVDILCFAKDADICSVCRLDSLISTNTVDRYANLLIQQLHAAMFHFDLDSVINFSSLVCFSACFKILYYVEYYSRRSVRYLSITSILGTHLNK